MFASRKSVCAGMLACLLAPPAGAASFSANPSSDAFVTTGSGGGLSGNNYGGAGALGVSAPALANGEFQSVLQFDLSAAKTAFDAQYGAGLWNPASVTLQLTATPPNNPIFNAAAAGQFTVFWMQNDSWTEGAGTPNTPTTTGVTFTSLQGTFVGANDEYLGTFSYGGATSGASTYTLNLTPNFTTDLLAGGDVSLRLVAADTSISYLFDSRSFGAVGGRPAFTITATPEPGPLALGAVGVMFFFARRFHRSRRPRS